MQRHPVFTLRLDGRPGSVRAARDATSRFLRELAPALRPDTKRDVVLVVSELVCNACRHAPGPCILTVAVGDRAVDVAVEDTSRKQPEPRRAPDPAGYGLRLVAGLSRGLRVLRTKAGKVVCATVVEH